VNEVLFPLRSPCHRCGCESGCIVERGAQDCVYCSGCGTFCYNAPRAETGKEVRHVKTQEAIKPKTRMRILLRANGHCEICGSDRDLHVGHLLSIDAGRRMGLSDDELNGDECLAAMCSACNLGLGSEPVPLRLAVRIVMARTRNLARVMK
jgi:hypothetical protein